MRIAGSVILVTGASRGIGRATAELLAERGATVVLTGRDEPALAALAGRLGGSYLAIDLTSAGSADRLVEHTLERHGRLDGLVANAGAGQVGPFAEVPAEAIGRLVALNLAAPMLLARAAIGAMTAGPAMDRAIVFVGSIAGAVGVPGESVYSACKAGLETFAEVLAEELAEQRIAVSTVLPAVVDTDFLRRRAVPYDRRFPRPMPPERVARTVLTALADGRRRRFVPRWLVVPAWLSAVAPGLYRRLARRFG
ncbi:MAG: SDR family NAD(P)-dependent oxidoreductase [Jatrophihabitantaceae bacterium]